MDVFEELCVEFLQRPSVALLLEMRNLLRKEMQEEVSDHINIECIA